MNIVIKNTVGSFFNVFEPFDKSGKYEVTLLVDKGSTQLKELEAAIDKVGADKWGAKEFTKVKSSLIAANHYPVRDGDLKSDYEGYSGRMAVKTKNEARPRVVDQAVNDVIDKSKIYSGLIINAHIQISAFANDKGKFVRLKIVGIQIVKDAPRIDGAKLESDVEMFSKIASDVDEL